MRILTLLLLSQLTLLSTFANASPLGAAINYGAQTDLADEASPRLVEHSMGAGVTYDWEDVAKLSLDSSYYYTTIGSSISKFPEDHGLAFVRLGARRSLLNEFHFLSANHTLGFRLSSDLPLRKDARNDGYRGTLSAGPTLTSTIWPDHLQIRQTAGGSVVMNRYRFSPVSGAASAKYSYSYGAGIDITPITDLTLSIDFGARRTHYSDGFHELALKNEVSLSYSLGQWNFSVSHANGAIQDNPNFGLWYVDQYRKTLSAGIGYSF